MKTKEQKREEAKQRLEVSISRLERVLSNLKETLLRGSPKIYTEKHLKGLIESHENLLLKKYEELSILKGEGK